MRETITSILIAVAAFLSDGTRVITSCYAAGDEEAKHCSLYLAKSTIENAGLGMFTGVSVKKGEHILFGDPSSEFPYCQ